MIQTDIEYNKVINKILQDGITKKDRTGTGTVSIFGNISRYDTINNRLPLVTTKKIHFKSVLHELLWFLKGDTNIKYLCDNNVRIWNEWPYDKYCKKMKESGESNILSMPDFVSKIKEDISFANEYGNIGRVYGKQWVDWQCVNDDNTITSINQIQNAINDLNNNPDSRRILVTAWYPGQVEKAALPPCHYSFQFYSEEMNIITRYNMYVDTCLQNNTIPFPFTEPISVLQQLDNIKFPTRQLSILFNMRSVDVGLGWCFDIASYGILLAIIAKYTNHITKEVIISSGDTHIYSNHIEELKKQLNRKGFDNQAYLKINTNDKSIFDLVYEDFELIGYESEDAIKMQVAV